MTAYVMFEKKNTKKNDRIVNIDKEKYEILSSSTTDRTKMGFIPRCKINDKLINIFVCSSKVSHNSVAKV